MKSVARLVALSYFVAIPLTGFAYKQEFPFDVSCLLSMSRISSGNHTDVDTFAHSCSDFLVANKRELNFVTGTCKLSAVLQSWAHKVVFSKCDTPTATAVCRVSGAQNPTEVTETFYYLSKSAFDVAVELRLFKQSCKSMGGAFALLNQN